MMKPALIAGVIAALPGLAFAQGVQLDGAVTLGYNFNTISGLGTDIDLNGYSIDFDGDLMFTDEFAVGLGFSYNTGNLEALGTEINIDLIGLSVEPVYMHESGAYIGAYYRMGDLDLALVGPITIGIDTEQYGLFGGYDFGQGHVEVFYGESDIEPNALIPVAIGADITDYGISASYEVMPQLEVFGSVMRTNIDGGGGFELPITTFSLGADYAVTEEISLYGAVGRTNIALSEIGAPDDFYATGLTLGASYDLTGAVSMPLILSAEYTYTDLDDNGVLGLQGDVNRFAVGLTIPLGNGSSTPLNSNTRTARGDYRSAVAAVFNSF